MKLHEIAVEFKKVKDAEPMGEYIPTEIDKNKKEVDFRLVSVSPYFIIWKDGKSEKVNKRTLEKLQKEYKWATDF